MIKILIIALYCSAFANDTVSSTEHEALKSTQKLLKDKKQREHYIQGNQGAQIVDDQVHSLGGNSTNTEAVYGLSAEVLEDLVKMTGGDADKMQQLLLKAKDDPKGFYESLSPETRAKIKGVSNKVQAAPQTAKPVSK